MRRPGFCSLLALAALPARPVFATVASDICPATADPCVVSSAKAVDPGSTLDFGSRALDVRPARGVCAGGGGDICRAPADPCVVSSAKAVDPGSTLDFGSRALDVRATGSLVVSSGTMTILAGSVRVESGGALLGRSTQA